MIQECDSKIQEERKKKQEQKQEDKKQKQEEKKKRITEYLEKLKELKPDSSQSDFKSGLLKNLKKRFNECETVHVLGVQLKYPRIFTCLCGHDLEYMFKKIFEIDCDKMIEAFTDIGVFVPDEVIKVFKNIGQNIIQLNDKTFEGLVRKKPYIDYAWFVRYMVTETEDNTEFQQ